MLKPTEESPTGGRAINKAEAVIVLANQMLHWQDHIEEAMSSAGDPYTFDDLVEMVMMGKVHAYPYENCIVLMEVLPFGQFTSYHCFVAVGDMQSIIDAEDDIRRVAKSLGCREMTINGRIGWPRVLKKHGWKHKASLLMKEV